MSTRPRALTAALFFACAPLSLATTPPPLFTTGIVQTSSLLTDLTLQPHSLSSNLMTVDSPPLNGYVPQVVFGLTDQQDKNTEDFAAIPSSSPGGNTLPKGAPVQYQIATFDTGSQSHIINDDAVQAFNFNSSGRVGDATAEIAGASGTETVNVTDPLGIYSTSFGNASSNGTSLSVTPGTLTGQWSTSILTANPGSSLPNLIGAPMAAQYQTVIRNSQTTHLTVNGTTYKSPSVTFQPLNTPLPNSSYVRLSLDVESPNGVTADPVFIPSLENFNNLVDNPSNPTFWASLFAHVNGSSPAGSISNESFLFDTGAEVTVLSQDTAAALGFYSAGPNISTPDFTVDVAGVGGDQAVPGFFVPTLSVLTNGGYLSWTNVPVVVLDVIDPRDGVGYVPGILGTNLFSDRDLIINGGITNPSVGISPRITPQWTSSTSGTWSNDSNWSLGSPDTADLPANFLSSITSPQTITISSPTTAGSLTFDNPNRYTLAGPGPLTLESSFSPPSITVLQGSHKIATTLLFSSPATLTISSGAQLDITTNTLLLSPGSTPSTTLTQLRQYLHNSQLISSTAASDPQHIHALGYLLSPDNSSITLQTSLIGDANLDGKINADDYALLDRSFAKSLTSAYWQDGDFNYDGIITTADYLLLDTTYLTLNPSSAPSILSLRESQFGPTYITELLTSLPEPSLISILYPLSSLLLLYRRPRTPKNDPLTSPSAAQSA
ncbi:MAG TPA: aspartyl protease family protein [Tepidisphaeraceae bacterium]|nr:aspartyl protease family protein [Tepidisphaeraceae bacterium]